MQAPSYLAGPGNEFNLRNDQEFPALSATSNSASQNVRDFTMIEPKVYIA